MKIFFKDPLFDGQLLRALNHVYYGGADIGECISTAGRIRDGDTKQWHDEWNATAERIYTVAEESFRKGHRRSACEAYLRASNYFRTAYIFMMRAPINPRMSRAFDRQQEAFQKAAALFSLPPEQVEIPYERGHLPGYFLSRRRGWIAALHAAGDFGGYDSNCRGALFLRCRGGDKPRIQLPLLRWSRAGCGADQTWNLFPARLGECHSPSHRLSDHAHRC